MEAFVSLAHGLTVAIQPMNLLFALIGVLLGTAVGVLPGIGPALTVALLLPITFKLDPAGSIIMFAGIYYGGMYGGSTTAILINTPGESASMATALEGNLMGALSLLGLYRAANASRQPQKAQQAAAELRRVWQRADKTLPELKEILAAAPSSH